LVGLAAISTILAPMTLGAAPFYAYLSAGLPDVSQLEILLDSEEGTLLAATALYDRAGAVQLALLQPTHAPRAFVQASDVPLLATAFIASADPDFLQHQGFEWSLSPRLTTLAEKLAARLLLADEPESWQKALRARLLAGFATSRYGQQQVLTWALNSATFGHDTFGVQSAAQLYFAKDAARLTLAESALLAAVAQAPALNPVDAPELAIEYQRLVLVAMHEQGFISDDDFATALGEPLVFADRDNASTNVSTIASAQVSRALGTDLAQRGGIEIVTTIDGSLQQYLQTELAGRSADAVIINPLNGQVLAYLNQSGEPVHPVASVLTPFRYLAAFAQGYSPASLVWDLPPEANTVGEFRGPVSMRAAAANGYPGAARRVVTEVGQEQVDEVLNALGLRPEARSISMLDVAMAYAVIANEGQRAGLVQDGEINPSAVLFIHDKQSLVADWSAPQTSPVTNPELAFLLTDVLADVSVRDEPQPISRPAGVFANGPWFVAYSPQRVVVVWAEGAANEIGSAAFNVAHAGLPVQTWQAPPGLRSLVVCVPSGQLPDSDCPETRREFFLPGNEPVVVDSLYERVAVNSLNGRLATVLTPQEFVELRLVLNAPDYAQIWARSAGFALPPEEYDTVAAVDPVGAPLSISDPAAFETVSGLVRVQGRLPTGTVGFDVQVGRGLYPNEWTLVVEGVRPLLNGLLANWDASGLSGIYAIQLQAWDADGNITRAYSIVTIE
jgi:membrane peptidoglycan carboxypeptidase